MFARCTFALLSFSVGLALVGCNDSAPVEKDQAEAAHAAKADTPPSADGSLGPSEIDLKVVDEKQFASVIEGHRGQVVLVDFWATWCGPCVQAFPHTVELHNQYKDQGLATISLSFDELANEAKVKEFLAKEGATFDNLISKYDSALVEAATAFDFEGTLPHYRLYDRTGKLRHRWNPTDAQPDALEQQLQALLAEGTEKAAGTDSPDTKKTAE